MSLSDLEKFVDVVPWSEFWPRISSALSPERWHQGQHISLIGANGSGKTVLAHSLLPCRAFVAVLATKPKDPEMSKLSRNGYKVIRRWPPTQVPETGCRVILWPKIDRRALKFQQRQVMAHALDSIYEAGSWCVYADELHYLAQTLGLSKPLIDLWQQGRSLGISLVASMQRPAWVPLAAYTESTHLFFFRCHEARDLKTITGIGSLDSKRIRDIVTRLPGPPVAGFSRDECCAFLHVNVRSGRLTVSRVQL